jgi:hypothetical protein
VIPAATLPDGGQTVGMLFDLASVPAVDSTWENRDLLVLEAAVRFLDENKGDPAPDGADLAALTGLSMDDVERALIALNGTYLKLQMTGGGAEHWFVPNIHPSGRRAVGQWPSPESVAARLVTAMAAAAETAGSEEERGMLRKTAAWFGGAGRDLLVEVYCGRGDQGDRAGPLMAGLPCGVPIGGWGGSSVEAA